MQDLHRLYHLVKSVINIKTFTPATRIDADANVKQSILLAVMKEFKRDIPDNRIASLQTIRDLQCFLKEEATPQHRIVGMPALELFRGQAIPPNVTLINYRKKKWNDVMAAHFIHKQEKLVAK